LPSYRAMLDREGFDGPEGMLAVGSEDDVREQLLGFGAAGATDLRAAPLAPTEEEALRTRTLLAAMAKESAG